MTLTHYKLTDDQYIGDLNLQVNPNHYVTHLCADTGMGKSSWVMEQLIQQSQVIFAVPQRVQITQLQARYGSSKGIDFIYGGHTQLSDHPLHIVCTYDQLPMLQAKLHTHHYLLVVDEVHKLYQAASYREEAVLNLIDVIRDERFSQVVTLSATFTPELVPYQIDAWLDVSRISSVERRIELEVFGDLNSMEDVIIDGISRTGYGPTVMRVNNKENMAAYRQVLEGKGLTCLSVNRDLQTTSAVAEMLQSESISNYDVVLTTSLLDEAININDELINELIVFNSRIHPEELKQFMGRFRRCNPKARLCIPAGRLSGRLQDLDTTRKNSHAVAQSAKQLAEIVSMDCDPVQSVRKSNQTLKQLLGFEPLRIKQSAIVANDAAIMARLFKTDTELCYLNEKSLEERLRKVFTQLDFQVKHVGDVEGECAVTAYLDAAFSKQVENREVVLEDCKEKVLKEIAQRSGHADKSVDTLGVLDAVLRSPVLDENESALIKSWRDLHRDVLANMWHAHDALRYQQEAKIWQFYEAAESNFYIRPILKRLKQLPMGTQMNLTEAREVILDALREVAKQYPQFKDLVAAAKVKGVTVKRNNHFSVTDRFVRAIFKDFTATPPVRSNNKYKITFNGIGPFGYQYRMKGESGIVQKPRKAVRKIRKVQRAA